MGVSIFNKVLLSTKHPHPLFGHLPAGGRRNLWLPIYIAWDI